MVQKLKNTGRGKSRFTVVHMENNTIINKSYYKNKLFCILTCVNLLLPPPVQATKSNTVL